MFAIAVTIAIVAMFAFGQAGYGSVASAQENPIEPGPENPIEPDPDPENPIEPDPENPIEPEPENPIEPVPENPIEPELPSTGTGGIAPSQGVGFGVLAAIAALLAFGMATVGLGAAYRTTRR